MQLSPAIRWGIRWLLRGVAVLLFIGLPGTVLYFREIGFDANVRQRIAQAIGRDAARITIDRLTVDPFRGLVAENIEVFEPRPGGGASLSQIKEIVLSLNLSALFQKKIVIDSLQLNDSRVSIPVGGAPADARIELRGVDAQLILLGDQARLTRFEGNLEGFHLRLSGLVKNPLALRLPSQKSESHKAPQRRQMLTDLLEVLRKIHFSGKAPELQAEVSGDLTDLKTLNISQITLRCGPAQGPGWRMAGLELDAEYTNEAFTIERLVLKDKAGQASGSASLRSGTWTFDITSSLDLENFRGLIPQDSPFGDLRLVDRPQIEMRGFVNTQGAQAAVDVTGSIQCGRFGFRDVPLESFTANFAWKDGKFFAQDLRFSAAGGEARADLMWSPGDFRLKLDSKVSLAHLAGIFDEKTREFLRQFRFKDDPQIQISLRGKAPNFDVLSGAGSLKLGRTALRDTWIDSGEARLEIANRMVTYRDLHLQRGKLFGSGTLTYDFGNKLIRLQGIRTTFPPMDIMIWSDPKLAGVVKPYRFHQPPLLEGHGLIHMKDARQTDLRMTVSAPQGMDYDLLGRTLDFQSLSGEVSIVGPTLKASIPKASLFGGNVAVKAVVSLDSGNPTYGAETVVTRVNFAKLTKLYFDYDDSLGVGSGTFQFTTRSGQENEMRGTGTMRVEEGNVFAIPLLGPLSEILARIIPGAGYQSARLATADFRVGDRKITTDNLEIEGSGFSLFGSGDIHFVTDKMDMSVRINAKGIPGVVLFPVSKLFEYVSTGTVSDPEWRPKIIPRFVEKNAPPAKPANR